MYVQAFVEPVENNSRIQVMRVLGRYYNIDRQVVASVPGESLHGGEYHFISGH